MTGLYQIELNPELIPPDLLPEVIGLLEDVQAMLLDVAATYLQQAQERNFEDAGGTFGAPWAPLSPRTIREKERRGYPAQPLVRTGRLASEIGQTVVADGDSVTVGINLDETPYAAYLHEGAESRNLPPRILVAITPEMNDELQKRLDDWAQETLGLEPGALTFEET